MTTAMASPVCRTLSLTRGTCRRELKITSFAVGGGETRGGPGSQSSPISSAVKTATTPGRWRAAVTSMLSRRAWAWSLRKKAACSSPGISTSSTNWACPVSKRGSSFRSTRCPMSFLVTDLLLGSPRDGWKVSPSRGGLLMCGLHVLGGQPHGVDDVLVAGAAAQVSGKAFADLFLARVGVPGQEGHHRGQDPRRAESALHAVRLPKGLLDWVQLVDGAQTFDRGDAVPVRLNGKEQTGADRLPVEEDGAGPAHAVLAAHMGAG